MTRLPRDVDLSDLCDAGVHLLGPSFVLIIAWLGVRTAREALRAAAFERIAFADALTELPNRRYFDHQIGAEVARADALNTSLHLLLIDVDHFKSVNDRFGHGAGDMVLRQVAALVGHSVRRGVDTVCRIGGDEFAVVLPNLDADRLNIVVERIRRVVGSAPALSREGLPLEVTISLGAATHGTGETVEALFARADRSLYVAKRAGRNQASLAA